MIKMVDTEKMAVLRLTMRIENIGTQAINI